MTENQEQILRKFVKRQIADLNVKFSSITYFFRESAKTMRSNIFKNFARSIDGAFDETSSNRRLKLIKQDILSKNNNQSPYNYFDLDTLVAYKEYLEMIINEVCLNRARAHRHDFVLSDFTTAIDYTVPKYFISHAGKPETGFYNIHNPINVLLDSAGYMKYESTPSKRVFENKHNMMECQKNLDEYLMSKHSITLAKPEFDFELNKVKFVINSTQNYRNIDDYPIRYINAISVDGGTFLRGFFDIGMNVYHGDIYDNDGNFLYDASQSGVQITGAHRTMRYDGMGK